MFVTEPQSVGSLGFESDDCNGNWITHKSDTLVGAQFPIVLNTQLCTKPGLPMHTDFWAFGQAFSPVSRFQSIFFSDFKAICRNVKFSPLLKEGLLELEL